MQWISVMSRADDTAEALEEVIDAVWRGLDEAPDFVAVFASRHHGRRASMIPTSLARAFEDATIVGCLADSVIGDGTEEERAPAVVVTAARLPGAHCQMHVIYDSADLQTLAGRDPSDVAAMLVLVDSFTVDAERLLDVLDGRFDGVTKFGGLASAGRHPGSNILFAGDRTLESGAVVVEFGGNVVVETIVAQGCRPIGPSLTVASHQNNVILEFDQGRPQDVLQRVYEELPPEDRRQMPEALHIGIELHAGADARAEYLVRPIRGLDPNSGALSVSQRMREGLRTQFHLRDAASSSADLQTCIARFQGERTYPTPAGALLFSCVERGEQLFEEPDHDTQMFRDAMGEVPVAGFFGLGEIGPVGGRTFVHAYTSTFAMFSPAGDS